MGEVFAWFLLAVGSFVTGWGVRGLVDCSRHSAELIALRERIARIKLLLKLKAYKEAEEA